MHFTVYAFLLNRLSDAQRKYLKKWALVGNADDHIRNQLYLWHLLRMWETNTH